MSEEIELEALRTQAKELDIDVDGRWSAKRIREEINKKLGIEKLGERDTLTRQITALGLAEEQIDPSWSIEEMRDMVSSLREMHLDNSRKAETERLKKELGEDFGKTVDARILKAGDGKISTGIYVAGIGNMTHKRGKIIQNMPLHTARELEDRGFVEIMEKTEA